MGGRRWRTCLAESRKSADSGKNAKFSTRAYISLQTIEKLTPDNPKIRQKKEPKVSHVIYPFIRNAIFRLEMECIPISNILTYAYVINHRPLTLFTVYFDTLS